jgi:hypothetical protein
MRVGMLLFSPVRSIVGRRDLAAGYSGEDSPHIDKSHLQGQTGEKIFGKMDSGSPVSPAQLLFGEARLS